MRSKLRLVVVGILSIAFVATGVQAVANPIQPGDPTSNCTLDYVFDGSDGNVYMGIAAHCVGSGQRVSTHGHGNFGTVVYDAPDGPLLDIALIEVDEDKESAVDPSVKGHPDVPTGVTDWRNTQAGDPLGVSGHGIATVATPATREQRVGPLVSDDYARFCSDVPASPGDSGGPIFHVESGKAFGIVSRISPIECVGTQTGPTVNGFLLQTGDAGFDLTLRTV